MFTKQDMADYLQSVLETEQKAFRFTGKLLSRLTDEEMRKEIEKIMKAEASHVSTCRRLLESLSE